MSKKESTKKEKKHKESELEEEINETESQEMEEKTSKEIIDNNQFHEFMKPSIKSFSPVLEKIETPQQESLEKDLSSVPIIQEKNHEEPKKYVTSKYIETNYEDNHKEQIRNENLIIKQPSSINTETARINLHPQATQNFQINPELQELRGQSQGNLEKDYVVKTERLNKEDNKLPFEQTQIKYKGKVI